MNSAAEVAAAALACTLFLGLTADSALADGAESVAQAQAKMADFDFEGALTLLEEAETAGTNDRPTMIDIYRAKAEAYAVLGRTGEAEQSFRHWLALDPSGALPAGSSPKLTGPFAAAKDFLAGRTLAIDCVRSDDGATLSVTSDPIDVVAGARVTAGAGKDLPDAESAQGRGRIALSIPQGAPSDLGCVALDSHGNRLLLVELGDQPAVSDNSVDDGQGGGLDFTPTDAGDSGSRPIYARFWVWGAAAAVSGGVTAYFGMQTKAAQDDFDAIQADSANHTFAEAQAAADRGERYARNTNIGLAATGGLAAISIGLLVHQLLTDGDASERSSVAVGIAPNQGGASVSLSLPLP